MLKDLSRCLGYYRVSTPRQAELGHAPERYRHYLKQRGLRDDQIFFDVDSGKNSQRKGYQRVLELLKTGDYDRLIVPCFDRFTRSPADWEDLIGELRDRNIEVEYLQGGSLKLETPEDIYRSRIEVAAAAYVQEKNQANSLQGHKFFRLGEKPYIARFGYIKSGDGSHLILNHNEYKKSGKSCYQVARELINTFFEVGTLSGAIRRMTEKYGIDRASNVRHEDFPRDHSALREWLKSDQLRGHIAYFPKDKNRKTCIVDKHEPLISEIEDFQIRRLLERNQKLKGKTDTCLNPLAGLCYCAGCGAPMRVKSSYGKNDRWDYLLCSGAYPVVGKQQTCDRRSSYSLEIRDAMDKVIRELCLAAERIAEWGCEEIQEKEDSPEILELRSAIRRLEAANDPDLTDAIAIKRNKLANLLKEASLQETGLSETRRKLEIIAATPGFWNFATVEQQKVLFVELVERVECDRGSLSVKLRL